MERFAVPQYCETPLCRQYCGTFPSPNWPVLCSPLDILCTGKCRHGTDNHRLSISRIFKSVSVHSWTTDGSPLLCVCIVCRCQQSGAIQDEQPLLGNSLNQKTGQQKVTIVTYRRNNANLQFLLKRRLHLLFRASPHLHSVQWTDRINESYWKVQSSEYTSKCLPSAGSTWEDPVQWRRENLRGLWTWAIATRGADKVVSSRLLGRRSCSLW